MVNTCSVILINWNGWKDTIECLETIMKQDYPNFNVIIVDNNSQDDSVKKIKSWASRNPVIVRTSFPALVYPLYENQVRLLEISEDGLSNDSLIDLSDINKAIFVIENTVNVGFAKANNIAIRFAITQLKSQYLFLLNNDTVIEKNCLSNLIKTALDNPDYLVLQSMIYYYHNPSKIWHVGGRILPWMQTKYYRRISKNEIKKVTFVSGCALLLSEDLISTIGFLSEKFFHGEEDFEFSMRLKIHNIRAAVVESSKVYHKIGVSVTKQWHENAAARLLNFALNRIIDIKNFYPRFQWKIWSYFVIIYFYQLMIFRYKLPVVHSLKLARAILRWSDILDEVKSENIRYIMNDLYE